MNRQEELDYLYQEDRKFKRERAPFWAENGYHWESICELGVRTN